MGHNKKNITKNRKIFDFTAFFRKYPVFIFLSIYLVIVCAVFWQFFFGDLVYFFKDIGSDTVNSAVPYGVQSGNVIEKDGFFRFWSFYVGIGASLGIPISLTPQFLIFFLLDLFGVVVDAGFFSTLSLNILNYALPAAIIAYFYFKTLNYSSFTAIMGGLLFGFSGYMIVGSQWYHTYRIFYFIFLIFAYEQMLVKKRFFWFPFAVYYASSNMFLLATNSLFLLFYSFVRYFDFHKGKIKGYLKLLLQMAGLGGLAILVNAPQAVHHFLMMYLSPRVVGDAQQITQLISSPENIDTFLRNVTTLLRLFGNDLLGVGSKFTGWYNYLEAPLFYIGLLTLLLLPFAFSFLKQKKRIVYLIYVIFWIAVAFLPILRHAVNFFIGNYYKNTIDIFVPFVLLFFAMFTLEKFFKAEKLNPLLFVIWTGILLIALNFPYSNVVVDFKLKIITNLFIVVYAIIIYVINNNEKLLNLKYILLLLTVVELIIIAYPATNNRDIVTKSEIENNLIGYKDETIDALNYIKQNDKTLFYRTEKDYSSGNSAHASLNDAQAQDYFGTTNYSSFNNVFYIDFLQEIGLIQKGNEGQTRWCRGVRGVPMMMSLLAVKYFLTKNPSNNLQQVDYDSLTTIKGITVLKNKNFIPLGVVYNKYITREDFKKLSNFKKQQAILKAIVIDNDNIDNLIALDTATLLDVDDFSVTVYENIIDSLKEQVLDMQAFRHKQIDGQIKISKPGMLFFAIPFDAGWSIYANGKKLKVNKANIGFISVFLQTGDYQITLKYRPPYFYASLIISAIALILLCGVLWLIGRKNKPKKLKNQ